MTTLCQTAIQSDRRWIQPCQQGQAHPGLGGKKKAAQLSYNMSCSLQSANGHVSVISGGKTVLSVLVNSS